MKNIVIVSLILMAGFLTIPVFATGTPPTNVQLDNSPVYNFTNSGTTVSKSITVDNNTNRALLVLVTATGNNIGISGVSGSSNMFTRIGQATYGTSEVTTMWISLNPNIGSNTITASMSGTLSTATIGIYSLYNVDQTAGYYSNNVKQISNINSTPSSNSITPNSNSSMLIDILGVESSISIMTNTLGYDENGGNTVLGASQYVENLQNLNPVNFGWSISNQPTASEVIAEIKSSNTTINSTPIPILGKYTVLKGSLDSNGNVEYGVNTDTQTLNINGNTLIQMAKQNSYDIYEDPASVKLYDPNTGITTDGVDDLILPNIGPISYDIVTNITAQFVTKNFNVEPFVIDVTPDSTGKDMLVSNSGNNSVSIINPNGVISTCYNIGNNPDYKTLDSSGDLWVVVSGGVTKISPNCIIQKYTMGWTPVGIYVDSSNQVWMTDFENNTLIQFNPSNNNVKYTKLNTYGNTNIVPDKNNNLWFVSFSNDTISRYSLTNNTIKEFCCTGFRPANIGDDIYGNIWTVDEGNKNFLSSATEFYPNNSTFKVYYGTGLVAEQVKSDRFGNVWIGYDSTYDSVTEITQSGKLTNYLGLGNYPSSLDFDKYNNLYLGNWGSGTVTVISNSSLPFNLTTNNLPTNSTSSGNTTIAYWQNQTSYWQSQSNSWETRYNSLLAIINQVKSAIPMTLP